MKPYLICILLIITLVGGCGGGGGGGGGGDRQSSSTVTLKEDDQATFAIHTSSCSDFNEIQHPSHGTILCREEEITFEPDANYWGTDTLIYQSDSTGKKYSVQFNIEKQPALPIRSVVIGSDSAPAACALAENGHAACFGVLPFRTEIPNPPSGIAPTAISLGYSDRGLESHLCLIDQGKINCSGNVPAADVPNDIYNPSQLHGAKTYNCALHDYGLKCWGDLGKIVTPIVVNPTDISISDEHMCILDTGVVRCFGDPNVGGSPDDPSQRLNVPSLVAPTEIDTSSVASCAIDQTSVICWGRLYGSNGYFDAKDYAFTELANPRSLAVGFRRACIIDGEQVKCLGPNPTLYIPNPLQNPKAIYANGDTTCFIDDNGLQCVGRDGIITVPPEFYSNP